jgi:anti-sigma-K factor RskA
MPVMPNAATKTDMMDLLFGADEKVGFFGKLSVWKGLTGILAAAAAALAIMAFVPAMTTPDALRFVSSLESETSDLQILAVYDGDNESLQITRTAGAPADGRVFQLWCIVEGKKTWSVGVLSGDQTASLSLPASWLEDGNGWSIAISEELPGGSTTDEPTGEFIAVSEMVAL